MLKDQQQDLAQGQFGMLVPHFVVVGDPEGQDQEVELFLVEVPVE